VSGRQSRADASGAFAKGNSPKQIVAKAKRKLAKLRREVSELGLIFEDIDNALVAAGETLCEAFVVYEAELNEGLEYWLSGAEQDA
jgi:hypothetical protein